MSIIGKGLDTFSSAYDSTLGLGLGKKLGVLGEDGGLTTGFLGSLFGGGSGGGGAGITPFQQGANGAQADTTFNNTQGALQQQQAFLAALQAQNGLQNQSNVYNALGSVAMGTGPNPAQAQLAQATGANVANQAALTAGQRGASGNVGMMARQAGTQGANIQQQAAGQGATLQAQQSLGALGQMGALAGQQVGNQANATNAVQQGTLQQQQNILGSINGMNQAIGGMNGQIMQKQAQDKSGQMGMLGGIGAALMADGGVVAPEDRKADPVKVTSSDSDKGNMGNGQGMPMEKPTTLSAYLAAGGGVHGKPHHTVPVMLSPGEAYIPPNKVKSVAEGKESARSAGKIVPGTAKVAGDSTKNDTYPTKLAPGGVVVKRTAMENDKKASDFVSAVLGKSGMKRSK